MVENNFRELELAESFFSGTPDTDLVGGFYEPVLTRAVTYD